MGEEMERDRLLEAVDQEKNQQQMWALLYLGLVLIGRILAHVQVNTVQVQTGNCCHNQRGEQRYFSGINCFLIHCVAMAAKQILGEEGIALAPSHLAQASHCCRVSQLRFWVKAQMPLSTY